MKIQMGAAITTLWFGNVRVRVAGYIRPDENPGQFIRSAPSVRVYTRLSDSVRLTGNMTGAEAADCLGL